MVTFRNNNNNRRNNFRRNDRNFKSGDRPKYGSNFSNNESFQRKIPGRNNHNASKLIEKYNNHFSNNENFQRKAPGRNNHNAPKLIEKYNNLAREALSSGDKILSENYFQHADHFTRICEKQNEINSEKNGENFKETSLNEKKLI